MQTSEKTINENDIFAYNMKAKFNLFLRKLYYFGFNYYCPFCNSNLKKFKPHGHNFKVLTDLNVVGGYRVDIGKCPICSSTERERLLFLYIFTSGKIDLKNYSILHVAPEKLIKEKFESLVSTHNLNYQTGDKFEEGYDYADCPQLDITKTDYPSNSFDLILCNHVLEHIPNDVDAMNEIFRLLKPGGKAILQVPISTVLSETYEDFTVTDPVDREEKFGQFDHVRIYGQDYPQKLIKCGFDVKVENSELVFGKKGIIKYGLNAEENIYLGIKN